MEVVERLVSLSSSCNKWMHAALVKEIRRESPDRSDGSWLFVIAVESPKLSE